jgi:hypothetical protein
MPSSATASRGNIILEVLLTVTLTTPSAPANTTTVQTYTIAGLQPNDFIEVNQLSHIVGLSIGNCWVSALNQLSIQFTNNTGSTISATSSAYLINVDRMENGYALQNFPATIQ